MSITQTWWHRIFEFVGEREAFRVWPAVPQETQRNLRLVCRTWADSVVDMCMTVEVLLHNNQVNVVASRRKLCDPSARLFARVNLVRLLVRQRIDSVFSSILQPLTEGGIDNLKCDVSIHIPLHIELSSSILTNCLCSISQLAELELSSAVLSWPQVSAGRLRRLVLANASTLDISSILVSCPSLEELDIREYSRDSCLTAENSTLRKLRMVHCAVSEIAMVSFVKFCKKLTSLEFQDCSPFPQLEPTEFPAVHNDSLKYLRFYTSAAVASGAFVTFLQRSCRNIEELHVFQKLVLNYSLLSSRAHRSTATFDSSFVLQAPNLRSVQFGSSVIDDACLLSLFANCPLQSVVFMNTPLQIFTPVSRTLQSIEFTQCHLLDEILTSLCVNCPSLTTMKIDTCSGLSSPIISHPRLASISITGGTLCDAAVTTIFHTCPSLVNIVCNTDLVTLDQVTHIASKQLQSVSIQSRGLVDSFVNLVFQQPYLYSASFQNSRAICSPILASKSIQVLSICHSHKLTDQAVTDCFANCPSLYQASFTDTSLQSPIIQSTSLFRIDMRICNQLTDAAVSTLIRSCPNLWEVDLSHTNLCEPDLCHPRVGVLKFGSSGQLRISAVLAALETNRCLTLLDIPGVKFSADKFPADKQNILSTATIFAKNMIVAPTASKEVLSELLRAAGLAHASIPKPVVFSPVAPPVGQSSDTTFTLGADFSQLNVRQKSPSTKSPNTRRPPKGTRSPAVTATPPPTDVNSSIMSLGSDAVSSMLFPPVSLPELSSTNPFGSISFPTTFGAFGSPPAPQ
eukprot:GILK01007153.1.p1 GENE.GILK01007153.1~~GILK01007153.1.p1  ORF type:complete len:797 (+),score=71.54 GILK01007153.1:53-2443(+)